MLLRGHWGVLFLIVFTVYCKYTQSAFGTNHSVKRCAHYTFRVIRRHVVMSIIYDVFPVDTQQKCVNSCAKVRSVSLYYIPSSGICHCNVGMDTNSGTITGQPEIIYGQLATLVEELNTGLKTNLLPRLRDCLELYQYGVLVDGVYALYPVGGDTVYVWCDMRNGGWTVFQRRQDGSENFYRNWSDYVTGFGDKEGEYWLGLQNIHLLTKERSELYIYMEAFDDGNPSSGYAHYDDFVVGSSSTNYQLTLGSFTGDCGDDLGPHNGMMFTTFDNDNDAEGSMNCAIRFKGAWWYKSCHNSNLNGLYFGGIHTANAEGVNWLGCWGHMYSLKETVMKIRRL